MEKTLHERLVKIQQELKAPKNQRNTFGNYDYRSCEDIIEAVKPLLDGLTLVIDDEVVNVGERNYVKATVFISDGKNQIQTTAFAREAETQKGMNEAQITGSASSYARKYALNGLFAIDDTKDADTMDNRSSGTTAPAKAAQVDTKTNTDDVVGRVCPKCKSKLVHNTTRAGKSMIKCSTNSWKNGQAVGCDFVEWINDKRTAEDYDSENDFNQSLDDDVIYGHS